MANNVILFIKIAMCGALKPFKLLLVIVMLESLVEVYCKMYFERHIHLPKKLRQKALENN